MLILGIVIGLIAGAAAMFAWFWYQFKDIFKF